jgi:hypothetical protein
MRNIPIKANFNFWGTTISSLVPFNRLNFNFLGTTISSLVPFNRLDYTQDELTKYIKYNGQDYCNAIMGVSCGDGGPSYGEWKQLSPYWKWLVAGGRCPKLWENISSNCTTGCLNAFGCV